MDEHRVGLTPILRTTWASRGQRPRAVVRPRYEWLYVAAFVRPETGDTSFWLIPEVNAEVFRLLVHAFAQEQGVGKRKRIRLVLDNAGWHVDESTLPEALTLDFLPAYSPELQPAERLWPLLDEPLVNRSYESIEEVEEVEEVERCSASAASSSARCPNSYALTHSSTGGREPRPMNITDQANLV